MCTFNCRIQPNANPRNSGVENVAAALFIRRHCRRHNVSYSSDPNPTPILKGRSLNCPLFGSLMRPMAHVPSSVRYRKYCAASSHCALVWYSSSPGQGRTIEGHQEERMRRVDFREGSSLQSGPRAFCRLVTINSIGCESCPITGWILDRSTFCSVPPAPRTGKGNGRRHGNDRE